MGDLKSPRLIYAKGFLFLLLGAICAGLLIADRPTLRHVLLLAGAVWGFARFYYFAFYVIEKYVDPAYKFAGLGAFAMYLCKRKAPRPPG